jgi:hypothetical protein
LPRASREFEDAFGARYGRRVALSGGGQEEKGDTTAPGWRNQLKRQEVEKDRFRVEFDEWYKIVAQAYQRGEEPALVLQFFDSTTIVGISEDNFNRLGKVIWDRINRQYPVGAKSFSISRVEWGELARHCEMDLGEPLIVIDAGGERIHFVRVEQWETLIDGKA